jgi:hypothetical protein
VHTGPTKGGDKHRQLPSLGPGTCTLGFEELQTVGRSVGWPRHQKNNRVSRIMRYMTQPVSKTRTAKTPASTVSRSLTLKDGKGLEMLRESGKSFCQVSSPIAPTLLPAACACFTMLSSVIAPAAKTLPTSRNVGSEPVTSALTRCIVVVGGSAGKLASSAAGPCMLVNSAAGNGLAAGSGATERAYCDRRWPRVIGRIALCTHGLWIMRFGVQGWPEVPPGSRGGQECDSSLQRAWRQAGSTAVSSESPGEVHPRL